MSPVSSLGLLALASLAAAVPNAHNHKGHQHLHKRAEATAADAFPACWSTCFQKYDASSESVLCNSNTGSSVRSCIDTSCKNVAGAVKQYDSWVNSYCSSSTTGAATGTGTGTGYPTSTCTDETTTPVTVAPTSTGPWQQTSPATYPGWSTSVCTETSTLIFRTTTSYSTYEVTHTTWVESPTSTGGWGSPPAVTGAEWTSTPVGECADVTVTTQVYETVTVTAGAGSWGGSWGGSSGGSGGWGGESSTTEVVTPQSPVETPTETQGWGSPSVTESVTESATSSGSTPIVSVSLGGGSSSGWGSQPTSAPAPVGGAGFAKRGLAYNDAGDCSPFYGNSNFGWGYNWGSLPQGLESSLNYIPMLWSNGATFVGYWNENAETCISNGATYFFSFNEPDMPSQANMSPQEAAEAWMQYMEPYAGRVKLVAPAVTNGVGAGLGINWLTEFLAACSSCTIDAVNQHWYDSAGNDIAYFQQQISQVSQQTGKPVFVTEWAGIGAESDLTDFMSQAMSWMDSQDYILGYSYYMVGDGYLNDGTGLSPLGQTYAA